MESLSNSQPILINSPDALIQRIRFNISPPAGNDILDQLQNMVRKDSLHDLFLAGGTRSDLPLGGIAQTGESVTIDMLAEVMAPAFNPYLISENIAAARSLLADCIDLRRRVEALQQDIFNLNQETIERAGETRAQLDLRAQYLEDINRLQTLLDRKDPEIARQMMLLSDAQQLEQRFGPQVSGYREVDRFNTRMRREYWPFLFYVGDHQTSNIDIDFHRIGSSGDAAADQIGLEKSGPLIPPQMFRELSKEASRASAFEKIQIPNERLRQENGLSNLESQMIELQAAHARATSDLKIAEDRWALRADLWARKKAQADLKSGLGLFRRLADTLLLYAELTGQLRQVLHSVEFGQAEVFGHAIPGFSASSYFLRDRYFINNSFATHHGETVHAGAVVDDGFWAPIDQLGLLLVQAEARQRFTAQRQEVWQEVIECDGEFGADGTAQIVWDQTRGWEPNPNQPHRHQPKKVRLVGLRLINEGNAVGISAKMESARTISDGVNIGGTTVSVDDDVRSPDFQIHSILNRHGLNLRIASLQGASASIPAESAIDPAQYMNRHANGKMKIDLRRRDPQSTRFRLTVEMWLAE